MKADKKVFKPEEEIDTIYLDKFIKSDN